MGDLLIPLEVTGALLALLPLGLAAVIVRSRWLGRESGSFDCSLRATAGPHGKGWTLGMARYEDDRIEWFKVFDLWPRPRQTLLRTDVLVQERRLPRGVEALAVMPGFVVVRCQHGPALVELAMSEQSYTGFASWLEAAPPGQNMSVA
jgi:hypothetical protein